MTVAGITYGNPANYRPPSTGGGGYGGGRTSGRGVQQGSSGLRPGGGGGAPGPTPQLPGSTPYGAAGESAGTLQDFGTGMLDPESDQSKRWMEQLRESIGRSTDASQRAAGYQAAQQGFGGGASPEMLEMQNVIGAQGREAEGQAASDFMLRAPSLGVGALGTALGGQTAMRGQDLQSRTAELANYLSSETANAGLEMQQRNIDFGYDEMENDRMLQELMMQYGNF